jgi:hypothetical protein
MHFGGVCVMNRRYGIGGAAAHVLCALIALFFLLAGCSKREKDPEEVEFEKRFRREAVVVKTCPGDTSLATGVTSFRQRIYRFQEELWFDERGVMRRVDAKPENVCAVLQAP